MAPPPLNQAQRWGLVARNSAALVNGPRVERYEIRPFTPEEARTFLRRYSVYILPMANKDGVARGRTRFNSNGKDLNRDWDLPAVAQLAPENFALEQWLEKMIQAGRRPDLARRTPAPRTRYRRRRDAHAKAGAQDERAVIGELARHSGRQGLAAWTTSIANAQTRRERRRRTRTTTRGGRSDGRAPSRSATSWASASATGPALTRGFLAPLALPTASLVLVFRGLASLALPLVLV